MTKKYICFYCRRECVNPIFRQRNECYKVPICDTCLARTRLNKNADK